MLEPIHQVAKKIRKLEVQGARNVAIAAIQAMDTWAKETESRDSAKFLAEMLEAKEILFASRATEPLMRNAIRWITSHVKEKQTKQAKELASTVTAASKQFLKSLQESAEKIAEIGARRILADSVILTHCHSSSVTSLLRKAKQNGRAFKIICTETRPLFQGRKTAEEMLELGVDTTMIVDSAARFFMNQVNMTIVGADAITSEGNVINKIGTSAIALAAHEARTPFYVVSELLKFDPATIYGDYEKIEEREAAEVWPDAPGNLVIRNPAFDVTRRDHIHGVICEEGIVSPHSIPEVVRRVHPWILK